MPMLGIMASQISGHLWAPAGAYDSISTAVVDVSGAASITFSSIPQTYTHLQLRCSALVVASNIRLQINSDATYTNYYNHYLEGNGAAASAGAIGGSGYPYIWGASASSASYPTVEIVDILDYTSITKNKTFRVLGGTDANGAGYMDLISGLWMNSSTAINNIVITPSTGSFNQYSKFSLYGIK
jgi:hypothetical protein